MTPTEIKFTRRFNVGQYEHEEYTVEARLEEDDSITETFAQLKAEVEAAARGEDGASGTDDAGAGEDETVGDDKPAKSSKKSSKSRTTARSEEPEEEEVEEETDDAGDDGEEDTSSTDEDGEEETEEEDPAPAKKGKGKKTPSTAGAKGFKKKPQVYQRSNTAHKDLFSVTLKKVAPKWKNSFESKAHAKKVSQKMEGKDFLDEKGKVLPEFEAEVKKAMGKFGK